MVGGYGVMAYDWAGHSWVADWVAGVGQAFGAIGTLAAVIVALRAEKRAEELRRREKRA